MEMVDNGVVKHKNGIGETEVIIQRSSSSGEVMYTIVSDVTNTASCVLLLLEI